MKQHVPLVEADDLELIASAGQPWIAVSLDGVIVGWNRGAERLFGWTQQEIVGAPLRKLRLRVDDPVLARALQVMPEDPGALAGRKVIAAAQRRDGVQLQIEFTVAMRRGETALTYHAFVHDVTDAMRVERFVTAQRDVADQLLRRLPATDLQRQAAVTLSSQLGASIAVLWTSVAGETLEHEWVVEPAAGGAGQDEPLGTAARAIVAEAATTRRAVFGQIPTRDEPTYSGLWIPVWAGSHVWGVIQLLTPMKHQVQGLALDVLTSIGAQVGYAVHQRRAEEQLRAADAQKQQILETSSEGILGLGRDGSITFANRAAGRAFGAHPDRLVRRDLQELMRCATGGALPIMPALAAGQALPSGDARIGVDGKEIVVEYASSPIEGEDGGAVLTFRDVTERRELEAERNRDLHFLQTLLDSLGEGVLACDADGKLTLFNRALREILGREVEATGPAAWPATFGLYDTQTHQLMRYEELPLFRALQGEHVNGASVQIQRGSRDWRRLIVNARPLDADGRRIGAVATVRDVTDHRQAVARMDEAERLAGVGVWEYDLVTGAVYWSHGMYRILGIDPGSVAADQKLWNDRMHPEDRNASYDEMGAHLHSSADTWEQRYRIFRSDGSLRSVHSFAEKVVDADGSVRRLRGTMQDVTERAEAEAALRRSEARGRQRDRMDSLGQLAGGIAHDFNNLLAVMQSYSEFALDDLPRDSPVREDVQEIRKAAERAAELTQRLLIFSRGEAVRARPLDMARLLQELHPMLQRTLGEHLEIVLDVEPGLGPVSANPSQLEQALVNLALNARDAMPDGGRLEIRVSGADVQSGHDYHLAPGKYVQVEVTDTGTGMPPEVAAHAFEPFFTTKPKGRGTGLGLATVYGVINEAGGAVAVRSAPGEGSTFTVHLPVAADELHDEPAEPGGEVTRSGPSQRVLVVEDDEMVRAATVRILERRGYRVMSAASADEALSALVAADGDVQLLVTDVVMPGRSGWDLHEEVNRRWPSVRTLFMSGHTEELVGRDALAAESIEFIAKPFVGDALLAKVEAQLRR